MHLNKLKPYKYRLALTALILCCFTLGGCDEQEPIVDDEGNPIYYALSELSSGIYIQFTEDSHRRPLPYGMRFSGAASEEDNTRIVWFAGGVERLVPEVDGKAKFIFISDAHPPSNVYFEHFTEDCYSFGTMFKHESDGTISFPSNNDNLCEGSSMFNAISAEVSNSENTTVIELGTAEDINAPFSTGLLSDMGYVTGLAPKAMYKIGFFEGTKYKSFYVQADTHIYRQDGVYASADFTPTKNGYFIIEIPEDLPAGLTCINGVGVFKYTAGVAPSTGESAATDESVIPTATLPPEDQPIHDTIGGGASETAPTPTPEVMPESTIPVVVRTTPAPTAAPVMLQPGS